MSGPDSTAPPDASSEAALGRLLRRLGKGLSQAKSQFGIVHALLLAATVPYLWALWSVRYPIMQDLPGHLETAFLHARLRLGDPEYLGSYRIQSQPWPNSLCTILLSYLGPLVGYVVAAKLLLSVYLLAWPLSVAVLARSLGRSEWLALLTLPTMLDLSWGLGFLGFLLGKPLVVLALAGMAMIATG